MLSMFCAACFEHEKDATLIIIEYSSIIKCHKIIVKQPKSSIASDNIIVFPCFPPMVPAPVPVLATCRASRLLALSRGESSRNDGGRAEGPHGHLLQAGQLLWV